VTVSKVSSTGFPGSRFLMDHGTTKKALPDRLNLLHDPPTSRKAEGSPAHAVPLSVEEEGCLRLSAGVVCIQEIRGMLRPLRAAVQEALHV
jgi:hypothetical protein